MDQVGRYQILEELGRGAHGVVYKALDPAIGRTIAIKAIALGNINAADRERVREGILREARLAGTLSHPNIVTVYDVLDSGDSAYIFIEFVDGKSLEDAITGIREKRPNQLSGTAFLSVFRQVAQALDYAHRKGIIHRDVKPANILLTDQRLEGSSASGEFLAKIADFGVAKFASHDVTQPLAGYPALIGTPSYMSPQQVQGVSVTAASDQFSLAVIAYEVLCGRKAFTADSIEAVLYRIRFDSEQPAHQANPALSTTVTKVLQRALAKNPEERFSSCSEFAGALEFALGDSPKWVPGAIGVSAANTTTSVVSYATYETEERSWVQKLLLIGALCLAVGVAIVLIVGMNSGTPVAKQVLDTRNSPIAPPPTIEELKYDRHQTVPPLDFGPAQISPAQSSPAQGSAAQSSPIQTRAAQKISDNSPTVVKVPVPEAKTAKTKPSMARQVKPVFTSGEVQLNSDPPGAAVTVDSVSSCITPCSLSLAGGRHTLAARVDGYEIERKIFYVPADTSIFLPMAKSEGVVLVSSEPAGASVAVDGKAAGTTPVKLVLSAGTHRLSVWDGARWHDQTIQVSSDQVDTRMFRF